MSHKHQTLRFVDDLTAGNGVWGYPTSKANFCEEDYVFTRYIAEFINTVSNVAYIYLALKYPRGQNPAAGSRPPAPAPWYRALDVQSVGLLLVGVFSTVFHGSMHQETQVLDELAMLVLGGALVQPVWVFRLSSHGKALVVCTLWAAIAAASVVYARSGDIFIHVVAFSALLTLSWPRALYLICWSGIYSPEHRRKFARDLRTAAVAPLLGFALWHVDLEFCAELRAVRAAVGLPAAWLLELHGWWHILTAIGASQYMRLTREMVTIYRAGLESKAK